VHSNRWKFQRQEQIEDFGLLWYSFKWRNHQPEIGRFFNIDPLAEKYYYNSTYAFSENKVISHIELEGLEAVRIVNMANSYLDTPYEFGGKSPAFIGGLPRGMTHDWYVTNVGTPSSEYGGALNNPNYTNRVNLNQYLQNGATSLGIDCSGLVGIAFNADLEKLMPNFNVNMQNARAMKASFIGAEDDNSGYLGTDFNYISQGDLIFNSAATHVMVATGNTRVNNRDEMEVEITHSPQTGDYVETTWKKVGDNWSYGHTFRTTDTILNSVNIEDKRITQ
jgi:RHS repeat-associated protein